MVPKKGASQNECINYILPDFFVSEKYEKKLNSGEIKLDITEVGTIFVGIENMIFFQQK